MHIPSRMYSRTYFSSSIIFSTMTKLSTTYKISLNTNKQQNIEGDYDFTMRIYNSDGSEPEMCGNGIRCFAQFLKDLGEDGELETKILRNWSWGYCGMILQHIKKCRSLSFSYLSLSSCPLENHTIYIPLHNTQPNHTK